MHDRCNDSGEIDERWTYVYIDGRHLLVLGNLTSLFLSTLTSSVLFD
jgi:hypothetical protein